VEAGALALLSPRECEIVQLLLDGRRVQAIAAQLVVSQSTVRNHLAHAFKKLGVHSQQELLLRFWA
jgi:DNA-binding NarL/FixJ family response regulator